MIRYRAIWLSDVHLGTSRCQSDVLLDFLSKHSADKLYLVGDIVDSWNRKHWFFDDHQKKVVELLTDFKRFSEIIYIDGNHDAWEQNVSLIRQILPLTPVQEIVHTTASGRKFLVIHGHQFDRLNNISDMSTYRRLYELANKKKGVVKLLDRFATAVLRLDIRQFRHKAIKEASSRGLDGIITGHTHIPAIYETDLFGRFYNSGDWVEKSHCTALVENEEGAISLVYWKIR